MKRFNYLFALVFIIVILVVIFYNYSKVVEGHGGGGGGHGGGGGRHGGGGGRHGGGVGGYGGGSTSGGWYDGLFPFWYGYYYDDLGYPVYYSYYPRYRFLIPTNELYITDTEEI